MQLKIREQLKVTSTVGDTEKYTSHCIDHLELMDHGRFSERST